MDAVCPLCETLCPPANCEENRIMIANHMLVCARRVLDAIAARQQGMLGAGVAPSVFSLSSSSSSIMSVSRRRHSATHHVPSATALHAIVDPKRHPASLSALGPWEEEENGEGVDHATKPLSSRIPYDAAASALLAATTENNSNSNNNNNNFVEGGGIFFDKSLSRSGQRDGGKNAGSSAFRGRWLAPGTTVGSIERQEQSTTGTAVIVAPAPAAAAAAAATAKAVDKVAVATQDDPSVSYSPSPSPRQVIDDTVSRSLFSAPHKSTTAAATATTTTTTSSSTRIGNTSYHCISNSSSQVPLSRSSTPKSTSTRSHHQQQHHHAVSTSSAASFSRFHRQPTIVDTLARISGFPVKPASSSSSTVAAVARANLTARLMSTTTSPGVSCAMPVLSTARVLSRLDAEKSQMKIMASQQQQQPQQPHRERGTISPTLSSCKKVLRTLTPANSSRQQQPLRNLQQNVNAQQNRA